MPIYVLSQCLNLAIKIFNDKGFTVGMMVRVFANGPVDLGSIPGRVTPTFQKWYLMPPCLTLSITREGSMVKWSNPRKGVAPSPTPWCSSYWIRSLRSSSTTVANFTYLQFNDKSFLRHKLQQSNPRNCHRCISFYLEFLQSANISQSQYSNIINTLIF